MASGINNNNNTNSNINASNIIALNSLITTNIGGVVGNVNNIIQTNPMIGVATAATRTTSTPLGLPMAPNSGTATLISTGGNVAPGVGILIANTNTPNATNLIPASIKTFSTNPNTITTNSITTLNPPSLPPVPVNPGITAVNAGLIHVHPSPMDTLPVYTSLSNSRIPPGTIITTINSSGNVTPISSGILSTPDCPTLMNTMGNSTAVIINSSATILNNGNNKGSISNSSSYITTTTTTTTTATVTVTTTAATATAITTSSTMSVNTNSNTKASASTTNTNTTTTTSSSSSSSASTTGNNQMNSINSCITADITNGITNKQGMLALLKLIKRFNLKQTEELLCKEANIRREEAEKLNDQDVALMLTSALGECSELWNRSISGGAGSSLTAIGGGIGGGVLSTAANSSLVAGGQQTKTQNFAKIYDHSFQELRNFVDESLDIYKHELFMTLYPILVQVYIKLVQNDNVKAGRSLIEKYGPDLDYYYRDDLRKLLLITKRSDLENNDFISATNSNEKFIVRMSRDAYSLFKRHIQDQKQELLADIVQKFLHFDTYEGSARSKKLCNITSGSLIGEARRSDNKIRVYYGLLKEIDFQTLTNPASILDDDDDMDVDAPDRPKKKKARKDPLFSKKTKSDPNAPSIDRIPLPELKDADKLEKLKALREATKRITLNKDTLPSVCLYTILNAHYQVCCAEISEDSSMLAVGFSDSVIKIWSLTPNKLREMKSTEQLQDIDKEADDVLVRMMEERNGEMTRCFYGHSGPVFRCAFSPEKIMLLSCSEDTSIRLWSLHTWTCIVVYRGHLFPVWDIRFSPHGYYFASCSADKTIRLWATDSNQPLRIFVGHLSDVDCIQFHPNSNYIASGSSDRTVRLWDVLNGQLVRLMTGHKGSIYALAFSTCGRYLASGSSDHYILIWDLSHGQLVTPLLQHSSTIHTISFSRDGNILCAGGMDSLLTLWDFNKVTEDYLAHQPLSSRNPKMRNGESYLLRSFPTKSTPFLSLHFTRRNLLLAVGFFKS